MFKIYFQIFHPAEVNIDIRLLDIIILQIDKNVRVNQLHQVVACAPERICHHIRAYAVFIVGISCVVILALVLWISGNVFSRSLQNIRLVIDAVAVPVHGTVDIFNIKIHIGFGVHRRTARSCKIMPEIPETSRCYNEDNYRCCQKNFLF